MGRAHGPDTAAMDVDLAEAVVLFRNGDRVRVEADAVEKLFALEDAFRTPIVKEQVAVDGLVTDAGKLLNGQLGIVVEVGERCKVRLRDGKLRSIKRANLKTAGGVVRTNSFTDHGEKQQGRGGKLFSKFCRLNHACGSAANVCKSFQDDEDGVRRVHVVTLRPVKKGQELLISYLGPEEASRNAAGRNAWLKMTYNFDCKCAVCEETPSQPASAADLAYDAMRAFSTPAGALGVPEPSPEPSSVPQA